MRNCLNQLFQNSRVQQNTAATRQGLKEDVSADISLLSQVSLFPASCFSLSEFHSLLKDSSKRIRTHPGWGESHLKILLTKFLLKLDPHPQEWINMKNILFWGTYNYRPLDCSSNFWKKLGLVLIFLGIFDKIPNEVIWFHCWEGFDDCLY